MSLYTKTQPVGIDIPIQRLQQYLHDQLLDTWQLATGQYQCYGRCYRNQLENGYVAEVYTGNNEYKEVYLDDRYAVMSFFGLTGNIDFKVVNTAKVHLIFFVNIETLKQVLHRGDEEVRKDVQTIVQNGYQGFILKGVRLGIDEVFEEYAGTRLTEKENMNGIKFRDMHPFHCFRFDFEILYNIKTC